MRKHIIYIGNKLSKFGYTPTNIETLGKQFEVEGYDVIYASSKKNIVFRILDMLFTIITNKRNAGVVIIDTYSTAAFYYAVICSFMCKILKLQYIPILHGGNLPYRIKNYPKLSHLVFSNSYTNVVISDYLKTVLEKHKYKYTVIHNNIDINNCKFIVRSIIKPRLIWVRSFHKLYNPTMAILVVAKLKALYPSVHLAMVGPDKDGSMEQCKKMCEDLNIKDSVEFTGKMERADWFKFSAGFDIFISTTDFDNLPVSIIEAQALGLVVISTNVGGVPYLVEHEKNGLLVSQNNVDEMVNSIVKLLNHKALSEQLSKNARRNAENYDWNIIKTKWNNLLVPLVQ